MICKKCGAQLNENAQFCTKCGCKIKIKKTNYKEENNSAKKKVISLLLALIVVLILILACILLFWDDREKMPEKESISIEETTSVDAEAETALMMEGLLEEIENNISTEEYTEALNKIEEVKALDNQNASVYLYEADVYIKQNDYLSAVNALDAGLKVIDSQEIKDKRTFICSNIVMTEVVSEDGSKGFYNTYDQNGNLIYEELYDSEFNPTGWNEYTYDANDCKISCDFYNKKGKLEKRCEYTYDSTFKLILVEDYNAKHVKQGWHEYKYDSLGKNIEVVDYTKNNRVGWKTTSEYDSLGRLTRNTGYDGSNRAKSWVDTMYDENGNIVRMTRYDSKGKIVEWNETLYDENNKATESINYNKKNKVVSSTKYIYNEDGIKTKEVFYDANGEESGYAEYNVAGKKTIEKNPNTEEVWNYTYQYVGMNQGGIIPTVSNDLVGIEKLFPILINKCGRILFS